MHKTQGILAKNSLVEAAIAAKVKERLDGASDSGGSSTAYPRPRQSTPRSRLLKSATRQDLDAALQSKDVNAESIKGFISARTHSNANTKDGFRVPLGNLRKASDNSKTLLEQAEALLHADVKMNTPAPVTPARTAPIDQLPQIQVGEEEQKMVTGRGGAREDMPLL